jgi:RNA polymerase sigma-70 factor (ECF subfamily)
LDERSDQILVEQAQRGDRRAYEVLVRRHYRSVFAMCLGILGDAHESADQSQETVLRGYLKIADLRDSGQFKSWLLQIAKNLCLDHLRRRVRDRTILPQLARGPESRAGDFEPLESALAKLPMELRVPLLLYYFDGKRAHTIAAYLGISHSSACKRLKEAKQTLHTLLTEQDK